MGFIAALWLPILLSAVFVFVLSSLIHMLLGYHANDYRKLPNEDAVRAALRPPNVPPGDYMLPRADNAKAMKSPEFLKKWEEGPVAVLTVIKPGKPSMAGSLIQWFVYSLIINIFAGYIGYHAVGWGGHYLEVFRFVGCSAFMGYSLALAQNSIWYKKDWAATLKSMFDGLLFGLITAGTFGWLWPKA